MRMIGEPDQGTIRVLLVEDEALAQRAIAAYLAVADGIQLVGVANDGLEAIQLATEVAADVAIVDIHMPRLNGIETVTTRPPRRMPRSRRAIDAARR